MDIVQMDIVQIFAFCILIIVACFAVLYSLDLYSNSKIIFLLIGIMVVIVVVAWIMKDIIKIYAFYILIVVCFAAFYFPDVVSIRKIIFRLVGVAIVVVAAWIIWQIFFPPFGKVFNCYYMTWSEYDEVTGDIHGVIEGTKWDTSRIDRILFPPNPPPPFDEPNAGYCHSETYTLRQFLKNAYKLALNNKNMTARFYLWKAEIYLKVIPTSILKGDPYPSNDEPDMREPDENLNYVPDPRKPEDNLLEWQLNN